MNSKALTKGKVDQLMQGIIAHVDPIILQRGWMYYRSGQLVNIDYSEQEIIAKVIGKGLYEVRLYWNDFKESSCTCPYEDYCKHMAAAFFSAYSHYENRPELFLQEHLRARNKLINMRRRRLEGQDSLKQMSAEPLNESNSIQEWHEYFESQFKNYFTASRSYFHSFYQIVHQRLQPISRSWDKAVQDIYGMHLILFILRQVELQPGKSEYAYVSRYEQQAMDQCIAQCINSLEKILSLLDISEAMVKAPGHMKQTMDFIRKHAVSASSTAVDWLAVYQMIWGKWSQDLSWTQREIEMLEHHFSKAIKAKVSKERLVVLLTYFDVLLGQDERAMKRWNAHAKDTQVKQLFFALEYIVQKQEWDRLEIWLGWLEDGVIRADSETIQQYCSYWASLLKHRPYEEKWKQVMKLLLPYSYSSYAPFLLEKGWYEDWVDLQLWIGHSPRELDEEKLSKIKDKHAAALLPLYHQWVDKCVIQKRRDAYLQAVEYLRVLYSIYVRLEQLGSWNRYINDLADKYSRLRAFQEELKKGNLI